MGIKNFSKIFLGKEVTLKNIEGISIAVDASVIAYQASLGMKNINALTDDSGYPTLFINVVLAKCINFQKHNIQQFWVFDYNEAGYTNPVKSLEIEKRQKIKSIAREKLDKMHNDELFSDDEEKIHTQERVGFSMNENIINDIKFILDCFNIPWCDAPKGYEAEAICAFLTKDKCDLVWTTDTDAIIYGAKQMIRELRVDKKKKLILYDTSDILEENKLNMDDLRKIAVIAGCDHCNKTARIGPKTILKKFKDVELTDEQKSAICVFEKTYDVTKLAWSETNASFKSPEKITILLDWLESKKFNRERIMKQLDKIS